MEMEKLNELADKLIEQIKQADIFNPLIVVLPDKNLQQWFKSYWLKTESAVLMSVDFKTISEALKSFIYSDKKYNLLDKTDVKLILLELLLQRPDDFQPVKQYCSDQSTLYSLVDRLSSLFLEYEKTGSTIEQCNWQKELYKQTIEYADKHNLTTLNQLFDRKTGLIKNKNICFFGFTRFDELTEKIIEELKNQNQVTVLNLKKDDSVGGCDYTIIKAPNRLREIEQVHSIICQKINQQQAKVYDFIVLAENIASYKNEIKRVFKQDNEKYPDINFTINAPKGTSTDLFEVMTVLADIAAKRFFTREDIALLVSNPLIQLTRDISLDQSQLYKKTLLNLNIFRSKTEGDDFDYLKKRILLSKITDINDSDNIVELSTQKYLPYSAIDFDDDSIVKLVSVIDDLQKWLQLTATAELTLNQITELKQQLDKWILNEQDNQAKYVERIINKIKILQLSDNTLSLAVLLNCLIDGATNPAASSYGLFTSSVSFCNLAENTVFNADYVFILNCNEAVLERKKKESEIDLRKEKPISLRQDDFILQYKNALKHCYFSYQSVDLKTDSELFPSAFLSLLPQNQKQTIEISLDEKRDASELFTPREVENSRYYQQLLSSNQFEKSDECTDSAFVSDNRIRISDMAAYLEEPFKYKAGKIFGKDFDVEGKLKEDYEPLILKNSAINSICKDLIIERIKNKTELNDDKIKENLIMAHKLPDNSVELQDKNYALIKEKYESVLRLYQNEIADMKVVKLADLSINESDMVFTIICDKEIVLADKADCLEYYRFLMSKDVNDKDYLSLYVAALVNIVLTGKTRARIVLDETHSKQFTLDVEKAKQILLDICRGMNDYNDNFYYDFALGERNELQSFGRFIGSISSKGWRYYDDRKMFDYKKQLGYNQDNFSKQINRNKEKMEKLVVLPADEKTDKKKGK
ncbi:MAG: hypothetical protein ACI4WG_07335 [Erysipelotrichaceae bacterium]